MTLEIKLESLNTFYKLQEIHIFLKCKLHFRKECVACKVYNVNDNA